MKPTIEYLMRHIAKNRHDWVVQTYSNLKAVHVRWCGRDCVVEISDASEQEKKNAKSTRSFLSMNKAFVETANYWRCPACGRKKLDCVLATKNGASANLVEHHCHSYDHYKIKRFARTLVCESCNHVDVDAKRFVSAPKWLSFSPSEMALFTTVEPHRKPEIDPRALAEVYARLVKPWVSYIESK